MEQRSKQTGDDEVLLNIFNVGRKRFKVYFHQNVVKWQRLEARGNAENTEKKSTSISMNDIINVTLKPSNGSSGAQIHPSLDIGSPSALTSPTASDFKTFTIHYVTELRRHGKRDTAELKHNSISFCSSDFSLVRHWFLALHESLRVFRETRPKNLLLFVNPYSGKRNALIVYEKYAKPLFQIANVNVTCIISQRAEQISDIIMEQELERYDGLVIVGGDGTFSEAFNGLIRKYLNQNLHLRLDDEAFSRICDIPIGIIGSGSTDCVAYSLYGSSDPTTAVLNIILGTKYGLDLASIRNEDDELVKMYCSALSYGYLGDIIRKSEKYRKWLGPRRYEFTGFKEFFKNNGYNVEITYLMDDHASTEDRQTCCGTTNCSRCTKVASNDTKNDRKEQWRTITGKFFMISAANIKCACKKSPNGISPSCHFSDGYIDIICVRHTTIFNNIKLLLTLSKNDKDIADLAFVERIRTRKFKFRALEKNRNDDFTNTNSTQTIERSSIEGLSSFNCDGELLLDPYVTVSGHRQILKVFKKSTFPSV
ncbi:ceramide kinase [Culicoides brevitarsis]|uniref:ceramide kinase n=1 Tax=Culicoides brevitarsis TaxID=469753 RepID=UPI00307BA4D5